MEIPSNAKLTDVIDAMRRQWQAQPAVQRWLLGLVLLALVGATLGLGIAAVADASMWQFGAGVGALSAALIGAAAARLSSPPEAPPGLQDSVAESAFGAITPVPPPLEADAIRDALTGAYTQRYFIAAADREWSRIRRHGEDAALLMIDADQLRAINDAHGMACGDALLVQLTRLVSATLRQYDLMARFNAGVLVVYLPQTDPMGAVDVAERVRERIANLRMAWPTGQISVTVSIGVAAIGADHTALDSVIGDAGTALRAAKTAGRNCVRAAPVPPKRQPAFGSPQGDRRPH